MKYSIYVILVCSLMASCAHKSTPKENPAALQSKLEQMRVKYDVPGASIAIISEEKILPPILLGWANLKQRIPVTSNTLFQACSMTKTLTSASRLQSSAGSGS